MNKKIIIFRLGTTAVLLLIFLFITLKPETAPLSSVSTENKLENEPNILETADTEGKPKLLIGDFSAPVTIIEYADFKCPSCNAFFRGAGKELNSEYIDKGIVNIKFRNYPFIGPDSGRAARGSYCANDQGVFGKYHDRVFSYIWDEHYSKGDYSSEIKDVLTVDVLTDITGDFMINSAEFKACIESTKYNKYIDADILLGAEDEITGTPGFVIGGRKITGPSNFNTFKTLIDIQLQ